MYSRREYYKQWRKKNAKKKAAYDKEYFLKNKKRLYKYNKNRRLSLKGDQIRAREKRYRELSLHTYLSHKFSQLKKEKHRNKKNLKYKLGISLAFLEKLWNKQKGRCALSGKRMIYKKNSLFSCSIDRIDPAYGYFNGNVQLVCQGMNFAKNKYSDNAIRYFWKYRRPKS